MIHSPPSRRPPVSSTPAGHCASRQSTAASSTTKCGACVSGGQPSPWCPGTISWTLQVGWQQLRVSQGPAKGWGTEARASSSMLGAAGSHILLHAVGQGSFDAILSEDFGAWGPRCDHAGLGGPGLGALLWDGGLLTVVLGWANVTLWRELWRGCGTGEALAATWMGVVGSGDFGVTLLGCQGHCSFGGLAVGSRGALL